MKEKLNNLLIKGRDLEIWFMSQNMPQAASMVRKITSQRALRYVSKIKTRKIRCQTCDKQLRTGIEIEFYNHTNRCYDCDSAYTDTQPLC